MLAIQKMLIKYNFSSGNTIKYIVVHDTGNPAAGANAMMHYKYFNGGDRQASAHYFVDDKNIIQTVEDSNAAWHCGDGGGAKGITNHNSIGIEICINSDGNYAKAVQNAVDLTKYLMNKYGVDLAHVVRHYDASGKLCPGSMAANNWAKWSLFKASLSGNTVIMSSSPATPTAVPADNMTLYIQRVLNRLSVPDTALVTDGVNGANTKAAVKKFQDIMNLTVDGVAGSITQNAINDILLKPVCSMDHNIRNAVRYIQWRLGVSHDGIFGPQTLAAIKNWQRSVGLTADGIFGNQSFFKLIG